jgi:hypothetical protein
MKGTVAFTVLILLIAPKTRALLTGWMDNAQNWVVAWAPLSYLLIALLILAPVAAFLVMTSWPKPVEPENPMAKYKHEDVME